VQKDPLISAATERSSFTIIYFILFHAFVIFAHIIKLKFYTPDRFSPSFTIVARTISANNFREPCGGSHSYFLFFFSEENFSPLVFVENRGRES